MLKTTKIAISLPKDDFECIEKIRKTLGVQRRQLLTWLFAIGSKALKSKK